MSAGERIPTDGGAPLAQKPFTQLAAGGLPNTGKRIPDSGKLESVHSLRNPVTEIPSPKNRGRVDITRQTAGRGGKTVTVASGFMGIGQAEKERLAKKMQRACGAGGTVKDGCIEIQGDQRETVARVLAEAGFRPVLAGG